MTTMRDGSQKTSILPECRRSEILEQTFNIIEFDLRAHRLAEAAAQFIEHTAGALRVDLAGHFHGLIIGSLTATQRAAERIGIRARALLTSIGFTRPLTGLLSFAVLIAQRL